MLDDTPRCIRDTPKQVCLELIGNRLWLSSALAGRRAVRRSIVWRNLNRQTSPSIPHWR